MKVETVNLGERGLQEPGGVEGKKRGKAGAAVRQRGTAA